jgi:hypothetical protein
MKRVGGNYALSDIEVVMRTVAFAVNASTAVFNAARAALTVRGISGGKDKGMFNATDPAA